MEVKKFFIKDFIQYCSPCFGCDHLMTFRVGYRNKDVDDEVPDNRRWEETTMAIVTDAYVEVELNIRYQSNLKLWIYHRNHKLVASDQHRFNEFMQKRELYLYCKCNTCKSQVSSKTLDFQSFNGIVAPISLRYEEWHIMHKNKRYSIASDFVTGKSLGSLRVFEYPPKVPTPDLEWEMNLLPKYKLGTQQKLIQKLNIYAVFS